jgi:polysaccharide export outer membrane protein
MKNAIHFFLIVLLTGLLSCRSSKELIYMNDAVNQETIKDQSSAYILKTGDILYVSIKSINPDVNTLFNPESNMESGSMGQGYLKYTTPSGAYLYGFELDTNGNITLPMFGKVNVLGVTVNQAETIVQKKADEVLKEAVVKVKLLNFKVTVAGEVRSPGVYYNYNNSINVLEVLALANGNTDFATIKNIMVIRAVPEGKKTYMLDLSSKKAYLSEGFYLQPDDYVMVQPDKYKNFQLNSQAYSLVLSSLSVLIAVLGFVIPNL